MLHASHRALLIDAMGTLIELEPPAPHLCAALATREITVSPEQADQALRAEIAYYRAHLQAGRDATTVAALQRRCAEVLREVLGDAVAALDAEALTEALLQSLRFRAFPDARPALVAARARGERVVVVSNWDASLPSVLARVGLADLIDGVVSSAAAGAAKPAPAIFARGLALAGVPAARARHVGDGLCEDVAGATAAGIQALWLNRTGAGAPPGVRAIASLAALEDQSSPDA